MPDGAAPVLIAEESRWRRAWPWAALAATSPFLLFGPFLPLFAVYGGIAIVIWLLQQRRKRAALYLDGDAILIVNPYSTHRVARRGASIEIGDRMLGPAADREILAENSASGFGSKALLLVPSDPTAEKIPVSVALGLPSSEFNRVVTELRVSLVEG